MPEMTGKIIVTGYAVPVDSCCVIDLTCRFSRAIGNAKEVADILRGSNTLKALEAVHIKCQPGWLLSQWCPESPEMKKSELPVIDCVTYSAKKANFSTQKCFESSVEDEISHDINWEKVANRPLAANSLSLQAVESTANIVHFWLKDDVCVGKDVLSSDAMVTIDVHSGLSLPEGSLIKLVAW